MSYRPLITGLSCLLLGAAALPAHAQETQTWRFKYFAGDPPVWKDHPEAFSLKAACEITRAEKTSAGYPVGECYALPASTTTATEATTTKSDSTQSPSQIEAARQRKLAQGCRIACDADLDACTLSITSQETCIQQENTRCIERCTSIEKLPHHQCINQVCLPDEVNTATWQGMCETLEERAKDSCHTTHTTCTTSCGS